MAVKVLIDPGHGGHDSGAVGHGLKEKDLTLKIAKKIRDMLSKYSNVVVKLTREDDRYLSLSQRAKIANDWKADIFISIHINSATNKNALGFESFVWNGGLGAATIANQNVIHAEIVRSTGWRDRGKKRANFAVLRNTKMPAILTENGFISNASDAAKLKQDSFLNKIAKGHVDGLVKACGLKKKVSTPFKSKNNTSTGTYTVKPGDTLWGISQRFGMTVGELKALNGLKSDLIVTGQKLKVKNKAQSTVAKTLKVGQKVKVKKTASKYATGQNIPSWVKGKTYTIQQVKSDRLLLKEIMSWVYKKDIE